MSMVEMMAGSSERELELASCGLQEQARLLADGESSASELVEISLRRIEATQPTLNAFRIVCAAEARAAAAEADRRLERGDRSPLLGVPVAIKDDVDLAGHSTPFGCGGEHPPAAADSELVARLRRAGAIVIGKTNAPEVGQWHFTESPAFGATRNPWNTEHTPGGSSGGAAAAVAAGLVAAAVGSDGAGSVRIPAGWTGLVGLKPQRGRISTWPEPESFNGLACFGPLTRSAGDAALLLDVLAGERDGDLHRPPSASRPYLEALGLEPRALRIAVSYATPVGLPNRVDPEARAACESVVTRLEALGHTVLREDPRYGLVGLGLIPRGMAGVSAWLAEESRAGVTLEARTRVHARIGRALGGVPLRAARAAEPSLTRRIGAIFDTVDVLLTPTTAAPAPRIGALDSRGYWKTSTVASATCPFAFAWNVTGWPGVSVPAGYSASGVPLGAQLLGQANDEAALLSLAAQLEGDGEMPSGGAIVQRLAGKAAESGARG